MQRRHRIGLSSALLLAIVLAALGLWGCSGGPAGFDANPTATRLVIASPALTGAATSAPSGPASTPTTPQPAPTRTPTTRLTWRNVGPQEHLTVAGVVLGGQPSPDIFAPYSRAPERVKACLLEVANGKKVITEVPRPSSAQARPLYFEPSFLPPGFPQGRSSAALCDQEVLSVAYVFELPASGGDLQILRTLASIQWPSGGQAFQVAETHINGFDVVLLRGSGYALVALFTDTVSSWRIASKLPIDLDEFIEIIRGIR